MLFTLRGRVLSGDIRGAVRLLFGLCICATAFAAWLATLLWFGPRYEVSAILSQAIGIVLASAVGFGGIRLLYFLFPESAAEDREIEERRWRNGKSRDK